ncbi:MAG: AI-2E family transporter [Candidatus Cloacimonetes bacterium]|jgi:putative permease|nr:AI-2E family transporter [Candidatus Cloacimonadota bacterium]HNZ45003.1 AI-2E family transporter [Candidatus Syntrophosphaera thermopropionivorans]HOH82614.1 AI-2E family transporter [Candidatus Syntrophosphaera thermopropionivorans]HQP84103.1 AI-2E family transporter [Candidatus Syntrophosphaera thermopropionivorans]
MNWNRIIFILLLLTLIVLGIIFYSPIFIYLIISIIVSYIFDPIVSWLEYKGMARWIAILCVYAVIAGLIAWLVITYIPRLIEQGNQLIKFISRTDVPLDQAIVQLPLVHSIYEFILKVDQTIPQLNLLPQFNQLIELGVQKLGELPQILLSNFQSIISTVALVFTIPFFSYFLLKDKRKIRQALVSLAPNKYFELTLILFNKVDENIGTYLRAILLEMINVGILSTIALTIVGVPYSIVIGAIAGLLNIIPYLGPWIGGFVAGFVILVSGLPPIMIVWMAMAILIVQFLDNYIFYPLIVGRTIRMHPLVVLMTVIAGSYFGGVIWMLISVPLVYMTYSLIMALHKNLKEFRII